MAPVERRKVDITVIGGGPAGYSAALRGAQLGAEVLLIEEKKLGGVCVNSACIPSKLLLYSTGVLNQVRNVAASGVRVGKISLDISTLMERNKAIINNMVARIATVLKKYKVKIIHGHGRITSPRSVQIDKQGRIFNVESRNIIIATGSRPKIPPIAGVEHAVTTEHLPNLSKIPNSVVIVGGGPEGVEYATVLRDMGVQTSIVEELNSLVPLEDDDIGIHLGRVLSEIGIDIQLKTNVLSISEECDVKNITCRSGEDVKLLKADMVILAMGRRPNSDNLGLEHLSLDIKDGWIVIDKHMATNIRGIYAAGDVVRGGFANVALAQGAVAAENALGLVSTYNGRLVPRCVFTRPEVATAGLTEKEAKAEGINLKVGFSKLTRNVKASLINNTNGFVKILADVSTNRILGVQMMCMNASEVISEASIAMHFNAKLNDIANIIHPYPTISESLRDAAQDAW